jgi:PAP2 superfamily
MFNRLWNLSAALSLTVFGSLAEGTCAGCLMAVRIDPYGCRRRRVKDAMGHEALQGFEPNMKGRLRGRAATAIWCGWCLALGMMWPVLASAEGSKNSERPAKEESIAEGVKAVVEDTKALIVSPSTMDLSDALKLGGALAVVGGMFVADRSIYNVVQHNGTSKGRDIGDRFSSWGSPGTLLGLNAGVIAIGVASESYGASSKLKEAGLVSFEAEGFAIAATSALKLLTGRARPESHQGTTHFRPFSGLDTSFASTHASASFAVATVFAERYSGAGWITYPLAMLISGSQVYTNRHFSSDVVAGALIGYGLGHFIHARHSADPKDWQIRPMALERGLGGGLTIGKQF